MLGGNGKRRKKKASLAKAHLNVRQSRDGWQWKYFDIDEGNMKNYVDQMILAIGFNSSKYNIYTSCNFDVIKFSGE